MTDSLRHRCELFSGNREIMFREFKHDNIYILSIATGLYSEANSITDPARIRSCRELIRKNTGLFSPFRSLMITVLATMLSLESDPEVQLSRTLLHYDALRKNFSPTYYLPFAAYFLARYTYLPSYKASELTKNTYKMMKADKHTFTSSKDVVFASLFATEDFPERIFKENINTCHAHLNCHFSNGITKRLSYIITLSGGDVGHKCDRLISIIDTLKKSNCKYGKRFELSMLSALALVDVPEEEIVDSIIEVNDFLAEHKGFGKFQNQRDKLMYSAMLVVNEYIFENFELADSSQRKAVRSTFLAYKGATAATVADYATAVAASSSS